MYDTIEIFRNHLKSKGLKATPQRLAVHDAMLHLRHASADMVSGFISSNTQVEITVSSVYNILSQMSELGVYASRLSANNKMYFDVNAKPHVHLYDSKNHSFKDIEDNGIVDAVHAVLKKRKFKGYKVDGVDIQIICHPNRKSRSRDGD